MSYLVLVEKKRGCYYMQPNKPLFHIYSDKELIPDSYKKNPEIYILDTGLNDISQVYTMLYNAGFDVGYVDNQILKISPLEVMFFCRDSNELWWSQYLLTGQRRYLNMMDLSDAYILVKPTSKNLFCATFGKEKELLMYLNISDIPKDVYDEYPQYSVVKADEIYKGFKKLRVIHGNRHEKVDLE